MCSVLLAFWFTMHVYIIVYRHLPIFGYVLVQTTVHLLYGFATVCVSACRNSYDVVFRMFGRSVLHSIVLVVSSHLNCLTVYAESWQCHWKLRKLLDSFYYRQILYVVITIAYMYMDVKPCDYKVYSLSLSLSLSLPSVCLSQPCPTSEDGLFSLAELLFSSKVFLFLRPLQPGKQFYSLQINTIPMTLSLLHEGTPANTVYVCVCIHVHMYM